MKKHILGFTDIKTKEELHNYLKLTLSFPDYYGKNLDALYDCLTSITQPTCIGFFYPDENDTDPEMYAYISKIADVFKDAEAANPSLGIIFV